MADWHRLLRKPVKPDWEGLKANLLRQGTPARVYNMELFEDRENEGRGLPHLWHWG